MATVDRKDIIVTEGYEPLCDFCWNPGLTEPPPSGIIGVNAEHAAEFVKLCSLTSNNYIVVSQRSDLGLARQVEHPVHEDMKKWITMLPRMGKEGFDFDNLGYKQLTITPRCNINKCDLEDDYSIKCDAYTWSTIPQIPSNIKHWYVVNCMVTEPKVSGIPFGVLDCETADSLCNVKRAEKREWLYINFYSYTLERSYLIDHWSRQTEDMHFTTFVGKPKPVEEYFRDMSEHRYTFCPDGNGVDCFRTWEALYLGSIPIVKRSRTTEQFADLPILIVDDLFNITLSLLEEKYEEILLKKDNLDKIKLSYWNKIFKESRNENCD